MTGQPPPANLCRRINGVLEPVLGHALPPQIGDCWCIGDQVLTVTRVIPRAGPARGWTLTLSDSQEVELREFR